MVHCSRRLGVLVVCKGDMLEHQMVLWSTVKDVRVHSNRNLFPRGRT